MNLRPHHIGAIISGLFACLLLGAGLYGLFLLGIFDLYTDQDKFRAAIDAAGPQGPMAYIALQALQVVLAPIPGEFTGSIAGILFGGAWGGLYATIGLAVGSLLAFILGRVIGMPLVKWLVSPEQLAKLQFLGKKRGFWIVAVIFLIPGFPKDVATYFFSLTPMQFWRFFFASQLGRFPGTILLTYSGSALLAGNWIFLGIATAIVVLVLVLAAIYRERIIHWIKEE